MVSAPRPFVFRVYLEFDFPLLVSISIELSGVAVLVVTCNVAAVPTPASGEVPPVSLVGMTGDN